MANGDIMWDPKKDPQIRKVFPEEENLPPLKNGEIRLDAVPRKFLTVESEHKPRGEKLRWKDWLSIGAVGAFATLLVSELVVKPEYRARVLEPEHAMKTTTEKIITVKDVDIIDQTIRVGKRTYQNLMYQVKTTEGEILIVDNRNKFGDVNELAADIAAKLKPGETYNALIHQSLNHTWYLDGATKILVQEHEQNTSSSFTEKLELERASQPKQRGGRE